MKSVGVQLTGTAGETVLPVYATPRAGRTEVVGEREGALWVRLAAPPVEGAANRTLIAFLAEKLGVPRHAVRLVSGASGRQKRVRIDLPPATVSQRLGLQRVPS